ncbi:hypothetical protein ACFX1Q_045627 [Malus domestica]
MVAVCALTVIPLSFSTCHLSSSSLGTPSSGRGCLRHEGKVILPLYEGDRAISLVISLHRLQTQAQATTFFAVRPLVLAGLRSPYDLTEQLREHIRPRRRRRRRR